MRNYIIVLALGVFVLFGARAGYCESDAAQQQGRMPQMNHQAMADLMMEHDNLLLDTVRLLKETAKDKLTKAKAEALEKRVREYMDRHQQMHREMMGGMGPHGGMGQGGMMGPHGGMMMQQQPQSAPPTQDK